ncbi:helix-turn-helix domain-containing protein [Methylobacterium sp. 10]|uniref:helix-turn-helix domain-containing protein n=1 Tax=Methylobacterium sp. 10 TaxID=1101191 RepID=UPI000485F925|nr:helix-turn-helix domain-containing protein [Methylobacterium sp. 10]
MDLIARQPIVLLAEADALVAADLGDMLRRKAYCVLGPFRTGAEALPSLMRETPTLAIVDIMLKDGACTDLLRELRQRRIPFLVHSAYQPDQSLAPDCQGVPWLTKPASPEEVVALCDQISLTSPLPASAPPNRPHITIAQPHAPMDSGNPFVRKLESHAALSDAERAVLERISARPRTVPAHTDLVREGDKPDGVFLVMDGFVCRQKHQPTGQSQIMAYLLPGDFGELDVALLDEIDHTLTTVSSCRIVHIAPETIAELMRDHPGIARALRVSKLVDEATLREWLVNVGCRSALSRMAHLFCELLTRMKAVGHAGEDNCVLPLTQTVLGNTIGITTVHVNRILQGMRHQELITLKRGRLTVLDLPRLKRIATFKPNYLHLGRRPAL